MQQSISLNMQNNSLKGCVPFTKEQPPNCRPPRRSNAPIKPRSMPQTSSGHPPSPQQPLHRESPEINGWNQEKEGRKRRKDTKAYTYFSVSLSQAPRHPRIAEEHPPCCRRRKGGCGEENTPKEPLTYSLNRQLVRLRVLDTICPCVLHKTHHILHLTLRNPEAPTYRC